ncbi:hypothetical protein KIPB_004323, partial [Kipferlia bialata]
VDDNDPEIMECVRYVDAKSSMRV